MFTWPEIVLLCLKLAYAIQSQISDQRQFQAGADAEIAKMSAAIMRRTKAGKLTMERVDAMSDEDVDAGLRDLEPK